MARNFGILLAAHGNLAHNALESLEILMGPQKGIETIALIPGMGQAELRILIEEKLNILSIYKNIIIITDLTGGTPSNVAAEFVLKDPLLYLIGGANLAFLCELAALDKIDRAIIAEILELGRNSMQDLGEKIRTLSRQEQHSSALCNDL